MIELTDHRFDRNAIDALGLLLGAVATTDSLHYSWLWLRVKRDGIALWDIRVKLNEYRRYLELSDCRAVECLTRTPPSLTLKVMPANASWPLQVDWLITAKDSWPLSELAFRGGLKHRIGTEVGEYDYSLSLRPTLLQPLWHGAVLALQGEVPLHHSRNFDDNQLFESYRLQSGLRELTLNQTLQLERDWYNQSSLGIARRDFYLLTNETIWRQSEYRRLRLQLGHYQPYRDSSDSPYGYDEGDKGDSWLIGYRYLWPEWASRIELTAGQFLYQDRGIQLDLTRQFGDLSVGATYKDDFDIRAVALKVALPLDSRRSWQVGPVKVHGDSAFEIEVQTTFIGDGNNTLKPLLLQQPVTEVSIAGRYLDDDRLDGVVLERSLPRLREAYWRFR